MLWIETKPFLCRVVALHSLRADLSTAGWFAVELSGKRDLQTIKEDEITSRVFGTILSLPSDEIRRILSGLGIGTPKGIPTSELWPVRPTCEPDAVISWEANLEIIVECKWNAPGDQTQLATEALTLSPGPRVLLYVTRDLMSPDEFVRARDQDKSNAHWIWRSWSTLFKVVESCYPDSTIPFQVKCLLELMEELEMVPWIEDMQYFESTEQRRIRRAVGGLKDFFLQLRDAIRRLRYRPTGPSFEDPLQPSIGYAHRSLQGLQGTPSVYISYSVEPPHWEVSVEAEKKRDQSVWVHALQGVEIRDATVNRSTHDYWIASRSVSPERQANPEELAQNLLRSADLLAEQVAAVLKAAKPK